MLLIGIAKFVLILLPFLLCFFVKDRVVAFARTAGTFSLTILFTSAILQSVGWFNSLAVLIVLLIVDAVAVYFFIKSDKCEPILWNLKLVLELILPLVFIALIVYFIMLPHTGFKGQYVSNFVEGFNEKGEFYSQAIQMFAEEPIRYFSPFYADEWINYGFIRNISESQHLPTENFLNPGTYYINYLIPFFSFLSFFLVFFGVKVSGYVLLGKIFNLAILAIGFLILKKLKVSNFASLLAVVSILFITSASNLTGIWHFIPINLCVVYLLLFLLANLYSLTRSRHLFALLSFVFYPPSFILLLPVYAYFVWTERHNIKWSYYFIVPIVFVIFAAVYFFGDILKHASNLLVRNSLYNGIEVMKFWRVVSPIVLPFSLFGLGIAFKKDKTLFILLVTTIVFWLYYSTTSVIFVIDKPRVVFVSAILLCMSSAFAYEYIIEKLDFKKINYLYFLLLIVLLFNIKSYTRDETWKKINLDLGNGTYQIPFPPLNTYFHEKDLQVFSDYKNKVFVTNYWKALTIAATTGNLPLETKSSYVSISKLRYVDFMNKNCDNKVSDARHFKINLVYSPKFECKGFDYIREGSPGFHLYQFSENN